MRASATASWGSSSFGLRLSAAQASVTVFGSESIWQLVAVCPLSANAVLSRASESTSANVSALLIAIYVTAPSELIEHPTTVRQPHQIEQIPLRHGDIPGILPRDHGLQLLSQLDQTILRWNRPDDPIAVRVIAGYIGLRELAELDNRHPSLLRGSAGCDVLPEQIDQLAAFHYSSNVRGENRRCLLHVHCSVIGRRSEGNVVRSHDDGLLHPELIFGVGRLHRGRHILFNHGKIGTARGNAGELDGLATAPFRGNEVALLVGGDVDARDRVTDVHVGDG